jgi:hypothetical protein
MKAEGDSWITKSQHIHQSELGDQLPDEKMMKSGLLA